MSLFTVWLLVSLITRVARYSLPWTVLLSEKEGGALGYFTGAILPCLVADLFTSISQVKWSSIANSFTPTPGRHV